MSDLPSHFSQKTRFSTQNPVEVKRLYWKKGPDTAHAGPPVRLKVHQLKLGIVLQYIGRSDSMDVENAPNGRVFEHAETWQRHPAAAARRGVRCPFSVEALLLYSRFLVHAERWQR
ncbi:hypothetical protein TNIN_220041 [Trichonephila inaurata madagascariensis]|uniref:Uncharacterized protein n=1 Tax=Trichonephila inaurata madagascariensis TaxID=2747483 RepID=A0A8X6Y1P6_9ARAC|nr:hypothetical protein TNIN_220041 [Trichonephila inaurata madagascariensis]